MRLRLIVSASILTMVALLCLECSVGGPVPEPAPDRTHAAPEPSTTSDSPSISPTTPPPETEDGATYEACYDGECEVLVTRNVAIPVDADLPPEVSLVDIQIGADWVSIHCESERLAACFSSDNFVASDQEFLFDTTVGLVIHVQRHANWQMVVTFSLS